MPSESTISRALATRLPNEHAERVRTAAEREGTTVADVIRRCVATCVEHGAL